MVEGLCECAGMCKRITRPNSMRGAEAPGTIVRIKYGMCSPCLARAEAGTLPWPQIPRVKSFKDVEDRRNAQALRDWIKARRKRKKAKK